MPKLKLDLRGVSADLEPVPEGRYPVMVSKADIRIGQESGKPYLWLDCKILEPEEYAKRHVFFQGSLNVEAETAIGITFRTINVLLGEDVTGDDYELDTDDLVGEEAMAVIKHERNPEDGTTRDRVAYLRAYDPDSDRAIAQAEAGDKPW